MKSGAHKATSFNSLGSEPEFEPASCWMEDLEGYRQAQAAEWQQVGEIAFVIGAQGSRRSTAAGARESGGITATPCARQAFFLRRWDRMGILGEVSGFRSLARSRSHTWPESWHSAGPRYSQLPHGP